MTLHGTETQNATSASAGPVLLHVEDLRVVYQTPLGDAVAVDDVGFDIVAGERFGLVGESGSGKSTIALALLRLLRPPGLITGGSIRLGDTDILTLREDQMRRRRLADIAMVAQGAMNSLNPSARIADQLLDGMRDHDQLPSGRKARRQRVANLLQRVNLPESVAERYPHELSGGMKQRVCIAVAISLRPRLIIADEPTSALDVVVQHQVMATLDKAQHDLDAAMLLIGHDFGLMAQSVDRVGVMYAGRIVEVGPVRTVIKNPRHPYTKMLIDSLTTIKQRRPLRGVPGMAPSLIERPVGCPFAPRCPQVMDTCRTTSPTLRDADGRKVACHLY